MRIMSDSLTDPAVVALIAEHLADMHATSPAESVHALDVAELRAAHLSFWSAWDGPTLLGCVALAELEPGHGELKSMRTTPSARGRGVATALLDHVLDVARARGYTRVSLETGSQDFFAAARRLYARAGFTECAPFGTYVADPNSVFRTLSLHPSTR